MEQRTRTSRGPSTRASYWEVLCDRSWLSTPRPCSKVNSLTPCSGNGSGRPSWTSFSAVTCSASSQTMITTLPLPSDADSSSSSGRRPDDANDLHPTILEAFSLEPLGVEGGQGRRPISRSLPKQTDTGEPKPKTGVGSKRDELPGELQRGLETVDEWLTREGGLDMATATKIRGVISAAVVQRYQWNSPLMREMGITELRKAAWPNKATIVSIEGAKENLPGVENAPMTFSRLPKDSWFFDSMLRADRNLPGRAEDIRRLAHLAEKHSRDLTARLQRHMEITDDHLIAGFRASLIGAALAGQAWPGMPASELIAAAFDDGQEWRREDGAIRATKWMDVLQAHRNARPELVKQLRYAVGITQGIGGVNMVDAARVLPLLDRATSSWSWDVETLDIPKWVKPTVIGFASWLAIVENQLTRHEELLDSIRRRQPRGTTGVQTMAAIRDVLGAAREVGLPLTAEQTRQFETLLPARRARTGRPSLPWKTTSLRPTTRAAIPQHGSMPAWLLPSRTVATRSS